MGSFKGQHHRRPPAAGKGRPKGSGNKITREIKEITRALFDAEYWAKTKARILAGTVAPAIEAKLLAYAYGEPKQTIDVPQLGEMAAALAKKVVDEFYPGPSKA